MTTLHLENGKLIIQIEGMDKLFALKSRVEVAVSSIASVQADPDAVKKSIGVAPRTGTGIPGVIRAGTFWTDGGKEFWDVHKGEKSIHISLHDSPYSSIYIDVEDPEEAVRMITAAISTPST